MIKSLRIFLILFCLGLWGLRPAVAQPLPELTLALDKNYYGRSDRLSVSGTVINTSKNYKRDIRFAISVLPALERGAPLFAAMQDRPKPILREEWRHPVTIGLTKVDLTRDLDDLALEEGVYPVEFSVALPDHRTLIDKSFLVVIDPGPKRLKMAAVWSLHPGEHRLPGGRFADNSLADMIKQGDQGPGLLENHLRLIEKNPSLQINLAAGPTLTDQLAAMSDGYEWGNKKKPHTVSRDSSAAVDAQAWLDHMNGMAETGRVEMLASPYGEAPIALLNSFGWKKEAGDQIEMAAQYQLGATQSVRGGFYLPGLRADKHTARRLAKSGFTHTVVLDETAAPSISTPAAPYRFDDNGKEIAIFRADPEIAKWLTAAEPEKAAVELTAMLAQRFLIKKDNDTVVITPATDSPPRVRLAAAIYEALSGVPWIETIQLSSAKGDAADRAVFSKQRRHPIADRDYRAKIDAVRRLWIDFTGAVTPNNSVGLKLSRFLYRSQSIDFVDGPHRGSNKIGKAYVAAVNRTIRTELGKIALTPPPTIAFSTKRGKVPVAIFNGADYPIKTRLGLEGQDFSFPDDMNKEIVLKPKENLISYDVVAGFEGLRKMDVELSVGNFTIAARNIEVTVSSVLRYLVVGGTLLLGFALTAAFMWRKRKH